jgi:periplasmic protein TonB
MTPCSSVINPRTTVALLIAAAAAACTTPAPTAPRSISISASNCQQPPYPAEARRDGASGNTELEFEVNAAGKVTRVAVAKSSGDTPGHKMLDTLALETLNKCSFPPAPGFLPATSKLSYVWKLQD